MEKLAFSLNSAFCRKSSAFSAHAFIFWLCSGFAPFAVQNDHLHLQSVTPPKCWRSPRMARTSSLLIPRWPAPRFKPARDTVMAQLTEGASSQSAPTCALGFREASNAVRKPTNARCTGFAIEGDVCTLLYPRSRGGAWLWLSADWANSAVHSWSGR